MHFHSVFKGGETMKKQTYEINENGHINEIYVVEFDEEGNPLEELAENIVAINPPNGLYRAKWTGTEWIEDMTQKEIDELNRRPTKEPSFEETQIEYNVDLDYRVSLIEMGL